MQCCGSSSGGEDTTLRQWRWWRYTTLNASIAAADVLRWWRSLRFVRRLTIIWVLHGESQKFVSRQFTGSGATNPQQLTEGQQKGLICKYISVWTTTTVINTHFSIKQLDGIVDIFFCGEVVFGTVVDKVLHDCNTIAIWRCSCVGMVCWNRITLMMSWAHRRNCTLIRQIKYYHNKTLTHGEQGSL